MFYNVWVTKQCNLQCKYCYEGLNKEDKHFQLNKVKILVEFIKKTMLKGKKIWINFHGGEPLIRFEIILEIIKEVEKEGIESKYSLTTNGVLLNTFITDKIIENNIDVSLSIDGNMETNDLNRIDHFGKGTYKIVVANLKKLLERNANIRVRVTFNSLTVNKLKDNIRHLISKGVKNIVLSPDYFDKNWTEKNIKILGDQLRYVKLLKYNYSNDEISISIVEQEQFKKKGVCFGGIKEFSIDYDGSIYPCTYVVGDKKYLIGNLDTELDTVKIDNFKKIYSMANDQCIGCKFEEYCLSTRCKFLNYSLTGELCKASPIVCLIENEKVEAILY